MSVPSIPFAKMNGLGNKIIVADMRKHGGRITSDMAIALVRTDQLPFDQIMEVHHSHPTGKNSGADVHIQVVNADGTKAEICGNGNRCVALWLHRETGRQQFQFGTNSGLLSAKIQGNQIGVDMGSPRFSWDEIPLSEPFHDTRVIELQIGPIDNPVLHTPSVVNLSNPHAIFWVNEDVYTYDLERFGPMLENHPIFPERANISIARVLNSDHIMIRTWERGAGITQACGSAACAALCAAHRKKLTNPKATVTVPGGDLMIEWTQDDRIWMTGPAEFEFSGVLDLETGTFIRHEATDTDFNQAQNGAI